jgi:hypothetical protein
MRRVWRLGQTKPVKVLFLVYQHTLEEAALALIGEKMKAALLLYGDNAASAITAAPKGHPDAGEASLLNELANRILKGEQLTADGREPFGRGLLTPIAATTEHAAPIAPEPEILPEPTEPVPAKQAHPKTITRSDPVPLHAQLSLWQIAIETESETEKKPPLKVYKQHAAGQLSFLDLMTA